MIHVEKAKNLLADTINEEYQKVVLAAFATCNNYSKTCCSLAI